MKQMPGKDMTLLGSGSILTQFAEQGLIDEYQIMVDPIVIGNGTPIFKDIKNKLDLKLTMTRTFTSGVVLLCYSRLKRRKLLINFRGSTSAFLVTAAVLLPLVLIGKRLSTPPYRHAAARRSSGAE